MVLLGCRKLNDCFVEKGSCLHVLSISIDRLIDIYMIVPPCHRMGNENSLYRSEWTFAWPMIPKLYYTPTSSFSIIGNEQIDDRYSQNCVGHFKCLGEIILNSMYCLLVAKTNLY